MRASKNECRIEKWGLPGVSGGEVGACGDPRMGRVVVHSRVWGVDQTRPVTRSALGVRLFRGRFLHRAFELGVGSEEVPLLFGAGPFQSRSFHGGAVTFNRAVRRYSCPCDSVSLPFLVLLCSTAYLQARPCFCALPSRNRTVAQALKPPWALRSLRTMEGRLPQALSGVLTSLSRTRCLSPKLGRLLFLSGRNQQDV